MTDADGQASSGGVIAGGEAGADVEDVSRKPARSRQADANRPADQVENDVWQAVTELGRAKS